MLASRLANPISFNKHLTLYKKQIQLLLLRHLLLASPLIAPLQNLLVPSNPIMSIKHPMILTPEVNKSRRNIESLQSIENSNSLSVDETIIPSSVNH